VISSLTSILSKDVLNEEQISFVSQQQSFQLNKWKKYQISIWMLLLFDARQMLIKQLFSSL